MAIFGFSPLVLSLTASSKFFTSPSSGHLDVASFLKFLAILAGITHVLGAIVLQGPPTEHVDIIHADPVEEEAIDEVSPLITRKIHVMDQDIPNHPLKDKYFWFLALYCFATIGAVSLSERQTNGFTDIL